MTYQLHEVGIICFEDKEVGASRVPSTSPRSLNWAMSPFYEDWHRLGHGTVIRFTKLQQSPAHKTSESRSGLGSILGVLAVGRRWRQRAGSGRPHRHPWAATLPQGGLLDRLCSPGSTVNWFDRPGLLWPLTKESLRSGPHTHRGPSGDLNPGLSPGTACAPLLCKGCKQLMS